MHEATQSAVVVVAVPGVIVLTHRSRRLTRSLLRRWQSLASADWPTSGPTRNEEISRWCDAQCIRTVDPTVTLSRRRRSATNTKETDMMLATTQVEDFDQF